MKTEKKEETENIIKAEYENNQAENLNNDKAKNLIKINPGLDSKKSNKNADIDYNFKKISIISSNQIKQVKTYLRESLQEHLDLIKKPEIIKLIEKDLNEEEKETVKTMIDAIPDEMLEKLSKKISNIYKSIKKLIKQTTEVDKKAKLKKLITDKEEFDKNLEIKADERLEKLVAIAEKVKF